MHAIIDSTFEMILDYIITGVEIVGAVIILFYTVRALFCLLCRKHRACRNNLTVGISTGLNFLLASEVLKTIGKATWGDIGMVCAILLMRAGMTLLVHWENKLERQDPEAEE